MRLLGLVALSLLAPSLIVASARAATIRVAQDGSGDFVNIADGVLAAASGDTVSIGPGVYTEIRVFDTPGGPARFVAEVEQSEITIMGHDRDVVIVGPEEPESNLELAPAGIATAVGASARVSGISFRNLSAGVGAAGDWVEVEDCRFDRNYRGVLSILSGFATIRASEFTHNETRGITVFVANGGTGALVDSCVFRDNIGTAIDFQSRDCVVRNSTFEGGVIGVQVSFGGTARIENCYFDRILSTGVGITGGAQGHLYNNTIGPEMYYNIQLSGLLVGSGNQLQGGTIATVRTTYSSVVELTNNYILNGGGWSVNAGNGGSPPVRTQNFTNNYWGSSDFAQIEQWVHDVSDEPIVNYIQVDYLPIADPSIPTETTSFGQLKGWYRH